MNPFKNLIVNLQARGVAAVASIWLICITLLAIFAPDSKVTNTNTVMMALLVFGGALTAAIGLNRD